MRVTIFGCSGGRLVSHNTLFFQETNVLLSHFLMSPFLDVPSVFSGNSW